MSSERPTSSAARDSGAVGREARAGYPHASKSPREASDAAKCSRCGLTNCSCVGGYGGPLRPPTAARECVVCGQPLDADGRCPRPQETLCTMTDEGPPLNVDPYEWSESDA